MIRRAFTESEDEYLRKNYPNPELFIHDMAQALGRTESSIYGRARILGLKKPFECHSIAGKKGTLSPEAISHRFQKGHIPANKGKSMPPEVYAKAALTMFKKGNRPHNTASVGDEAIRKGGYIYVKVAEPNVWRAKHKMLWESINGKIPKGYNIQFKNRDVTDIRILNLYMISRSEQLKKENSLMARYPEDLQKVIRLKGSLKRQITIQKKKENE